MQPPRRGTPLSGSKGLPDENAAPSMCRATTACPCRAEGTAAGAAPGAHAASCTGPARQGASPPARRRCPSKRLHFRHRPAAPASYQQHTDRRPETGKAGNLQYLGPAAQARPLCWRYATTRARAPVANPSEHRDAWRNRQALGFQGQAAAGCPAAHARHALHGEVPRQHLLHQSRDQWKENSCEWEVEQKVCRAKQSLGGQFHAVLGSLGRCCTS